MSLTCPNCSQPIAPFNIRSHLVCSKCSAKLTTHIFWPAIAAIIIWSILEAIVAELLYSNLGHSWLAVVLKIAFSAAIGFPLFYFIINKYGAITSNDAH